LKIYSGTPLPKNGAGAPVKYPFEEMKPEDHFIVKCGKNEKPNVKRSSILTTAKQRGFKVKIRTNGDSIMCWMVGKKNG